LETNAQVPGLCLYFFKALNSVDHVILIDQLSKLKLRLFMLNYHISFVTRRTHITKIICGESRPLPINLSIVQGFGIGPTLYITLESDLKPLSNQNIIFL
jgi:hypothetical protein